MITAIKHCETDPEALRQETDRSRDLQEIYVSLAIYICPGKRNEYKEGKNVGILFCIVLEGRREWNYFGSLA